MQRNQMDVYSMSFSRGRNDGVNKGRRAVGR